MQGRTHGGGPGPHPGSGDLGASMHQREGSDRTEVGVRAGGSLGGTGRGEGAACGAPLGLAHPSHRRTASQEPRCQPGKLLLPQMPRPSRSERVSVSFQNFPGHGDRSQHFCSQNRMVRKLRRTARVGTGRPGALGGSWRGRAAWALGPHRRGPRGSGNLSTPSLLCGEMKTPAQQKRS